MIDVLFPFSQNIEVSDDANNTSLISKLIYGENEILLTGDSGIPVEEKLIASGVSLTADILKVGHHGSKTSTSEEFLRAVNPAYAVISVGKDNSYHHPHPSVMKRLARCNREILRTDRDGRIEMIFSKMKLLQIKTHGKRVISAPREHNFPSNCS
jgi:competence protein ComEC